jgi:signal transduction histidine kinase
MKLFSLIAFTTIFIVLSAIPALTQDKSSPAEVLAMTRKAADYIASIGKKGLEEFNDPQSRWVVKDTYVFVINCEQGTIVSHPFSQKLRGKKLLGLTDIKGNLFFVDFCEAAKKPMGGWTEYWWNKPGEKKPSRKISVVLQVPDMPYQVGAGIYDDKLPVQQLQKLLNQ